MARGFPRKEFALEMVGRWAHAVWMCISVTFAPPIPMTPSFMGSWFIESRDISNWYSTLLKVKEEAEMGPLCETFLIVVNKF